MRSLYESILDDESIVSGRLSTDMMRLAHPKTSEELKTAVDEAIKILGDEADLNWIDTSKITDMSYIFGGTQFNGDISKWDTSKVRTMLNMFRNSLFNGDISKWDTSRVENMAYMFEDSKFSGDISKWNVSKVSSRICMFNNCPIPEKNKPKFKI